jgi:trehalose 6-phosphate synthase
MTSAGAEFVVVANRLPVRQVQDPESDAMSWEVSPGGLVAALTPSLAEYRDVAWVGWTGHIGVELTEPFSHGHLELIPVGLSAEEKELHYEGMSNGTFWPLYHDKVRAPEFHRTWWDGYQRVNERFAQAVSDAAAPGARVWIHDYQLQLVSGILRESRPDLRIGFFLHIPFPPPELFTQLPWRSHIVEALLGNDVVGFQTPADAENFYRLAVGLDLADSEGKWTLSTRGRSVEVRAFPIGIDEARVAFEARDADVSAAAHELRAQLGHPSTVMLGVDRLDYTKGIDVRLRAFGELLSEGKLSGHEVTMIQVAEPSRDQVDAYVDLRERVERLVGAINGEHGRVGFPVVHYLHQSRRFEELLALYRAADVMLVTPFRDGMNLVAKEYVAARPDESGVLILSEFAGAAVELTEAVTVNPYDLNGVKAAIMAAVTMDASEARMRMRSLQATVRHNDAVTWARSFLGALDAT